MPQFFHSLRFFSSLLIVGATLAGSAQGQTTARITVGGSPSARHGALAESAAPAAQETLHLVFALSSSRRAALDSYVQSQYDPSSPNYHQWLTPDEFGARFGATDSDIAAVTQYAQAQGFAVTQVWPNRLFVSVDAPAAVAERAFGVKLQGYLRSQSETDAGLPATFHAPDRAPSLPAAIAARVEGLFGLSSEAAALPALARQKSATSATPHVIASPAGPSDIAAFYGFDQLHLHQINGSGQSIAIFSPTKYSASDFAHFTAHYGITGVTLTEVLVNGGPTNSGGLDEAALDLDVVAGQATNSHIYLYESPNDSNLQIWNKIATDNVPVVSVSWGNSEQQVTSQYANSVNTILQQMAAQGQSVFAAAGDAGAYDGNPTTPSVDFPGSSPYVTMVGGTSSANGVTEIGWSLSGGGVSAFFGLPSWQVGPGVVNNYSNGRRELPDIAALSNPYEPGFNIYSDGSFQAFGGTSAATPLIAAANVLFNQGLNGRTGQLTPKLYQIASDPTKYPLVFNDVTQGNNGYYSCASGWDYVTGLGSPKIAGLYAQLVSTPLGGAPPTITQISPSQEPAGGSAFTLTITGANYTATSVANWNGTALMTQFVSATTLTANVPAALLSTVGTAAITVTDSSVTGGSNATSFTISSPHTFAAGLQMISAPYDYTGSPFTTVLGNSSVKIAAWDASLSSYALNPTSPADTFHLGRAYWARFTTPTGLTSLGTSPAAGSSYTVSAAAGWNMIADPFPSDIALSAVQVSANGTSVSFASAVTAGTVSGTLYRYDTTLHYYVAQTAGSLTPYTGYWLYANHACNLVFTP